jgi:hypothetical protein
MSEGAMSTDSFNVPIAHLVGDKRQILGLDVQHAGAGAIVRVRRIDQLWIRPKHRSAHDVMLQVVCSFAPKRAGIRLNVVLRAEGAQTRGVRRWR